MKECSTKWVELFALTYATAKDCEVPLIEEVFLPYRLPRRLVCGNGQQFGPLFVSAVMQQVYFLLEIKPSLTLVYHPQANLIERKNRDLKPKLAMQNEPYKMNHRLLQLYKGHERVERTAPCSNKENTNPEGKLHTLDDIYNF